MTKTLHTELTGARWSSAVVCPRRAVYDHQAAPQDEPDDQTRRWRERGHAVEKVIRDEKLATFRAEGRRPRAEELIPWPRANPIGTGHADAYVPSERGIVEITSTAGAQLGAHKALQVAGYLRNHPNAEQAIVISVDPSTWEERTYPIRLDGLEAQLERIEDAVVEGARTGELPERTCLTPFDSAARFCPYVWTTCFGADWAKPEPDVLIGMLEQATALADATDQLSLAAERVKELTAQRDELRNELRPFVPSTLTERGTVLEQGEPVRIGDVTVSLTTSIQRSYSLSDAEHAGYFLPDEHEAFTTESWVERWTVKRDEAPAGEQEPTA